MHKININLHNLQTTLIFSMEIFARVFVLTWFKYVPNYIIFVAPQPRSEGDGWNPPSPGCEMGSKDPVFLGLKALVNIVVDRLKKKKLTVLTDLYNYTCMFKWMNKRPRYKNNKIPAFTMKLSTNVLFFVVYDNNYNTVVYGGNIIRFPLF